LGNYFFNIQSSMFNHQRSIINVQSSMFNHRCSIIFTQYCANGTINLNSKIQNCGRAATIQNSKFKIQNCGSAATIQKSKFKIQK